MTSYLKCLIYAGCMTMCIFPYLHKKGSIVKGVIFLLIYALLRFFVVGDEMYQLEGYFLVFMSIVVVDWLMMSWLNSKTETWILFYTTLYFGGYIVISHIFDYYYLNMDVIQQMTISFLANGLCCLGFFGLKRYQLLPLKNTVQQHAHIFIVINILIIMIFSIFFGFQIIKIQGSYVFLIDGIVFILWICLIFMMKQSFVLNDEKSELMLMNVYNQNIEQYIEHYLWEHEKLAKVKHDFKNHMLILDKLDDLNKIKSYIRYIQDDIQDIKWIESSGNIYVDTCLNIKKQTYHNVQFDTDFQIKDLHMNEKDLCSLLFNLLDNAGKAANECGGCIHLSMIYNNGNLILSIDNDCENQTDFKSSIADHGYGMKIIQGIVKKYDGAIEMRYDQRKVYVDICLTV